MTPLGAAEDDLRCVDLVQVVSAFIDGELDQSEQVRIRRHLAGCEGCRAAIDQFETVIRLAGRVSPADVASLDPVIRDRLTTILRLPRRR